MADTDPTNRAKASIALPPNTVTFAHETLQGHGVNSEGAPVLFVADGVPGVPDHPGATRTDWAANAEIKEQDPRVMRATLERLRRMIPRARSRAEVKDLYLATKNALAPFAKRRDRAHNWARLQREHPKTAARLKAALDAKGWSVADSVGAPWKMAERVVAHELKLSVRTVHDYVVRPVRRRRRR